MSIDVTLTTLTANTPVQLQYCFLNGSSCVPVGTVTSLPYVFTVPSHYSDSNFLLRMIDAANCIHSETIPISPTPTNTQTPTITPSITPTNTQTPTITPTKTQTPTITSTTSRTPTITPTITQTPSQTIKYVAHKIARTFYPTSGVSCIDNMTNTEYYTYSSGATFVPVINSVIYENALNGVLFNPINGNDKFLKMQFGSNFYAVKINTTGGTDAFGLCS